MTFWHTKLGHKARTKNCNTKYRHILFVTGNGLIYCRKGNFLPFIDPRILQREFNSAKKKSPWLMRSAFLPIRKHAQSDSIFTRGQFSTPPYHPSQNFFQFSSHPSDFDTLCYGTWRRGTKSERNTKTQHSHLVVLQVTTVQISCVSDIWDPDAGTGIGEMWKSC